MAAERARSMKSKIAMVFFGLALGCVAGETAVRVLDLKTEPEFVFHNLQQSDQKRLDRAILTNDAFNPAAVRIAFVGDSFTYGLGVEPGQTFVNRTGALLEERWSPRCKTVNLGEPGADMISEWLTYMGAKDRIRPHVVVHVLTPNDLDFDNYEGMWEVKRAYEVRLWPSRISRLFAFCEFAVRGKIGHRCTLDYMSGGATPEEQDRAWRLTRCSIESMKGLVEEDGGVYVLARFPLLIDMDASCQEGVRRKMAEMAGQLGIPFVDLHEILCDRDSDQLHLPNDTHPSVEAHELVAEGLSEFLASRILCTLPEKSILPLPVKRPARMQRKAKLLFLKKILHCEPTCRSAKVHLKWLLQPDQKQ